MALNAASNSVMTSFSREPFVASYIASVSGALYCPGFGEGWRFVINFLVVMMVLKCRGIGSLWIQLYME